MLHIDWKCTYNMQYILIFEVSLCVTVEVAVDIPVTS